MVAIVWGIDTLYLGTWIRRDGVKRFRFRVRSLGGQGLSWHFFGALFMGVCVCVCFLCFLARSKEYISLNEYQYHVEVNLKYMLVQLSSGYGTIILANIEAPTVSK